MHAYETRCAHALPGSLDASAGSAQPPGVRLLSLASTGAAVKSTGAYLPHSAARCGNVGGARCRTVVRQRRWTVVGRWARNALGAGL